jgi:hypothetical protein
MMKAKPNPHLYCKNLGRRLNTKAQWATKIHPNECQMARRKGMLSAQILQRRK